MPSKKDRREQNSSQDLTMIKLEYDQAMVDMEQENENL